MTTQYNLGLKVHARALRQRMTDAEQTLWSKLRRKQIHGVQFYRQKPLGCYIVDFYAPGAKLVIELDGSQHFEPEHVQRDAVRDSYLQGLGLRVLRFNNLQVLQELEAVLEEIARVVGERVAAGGNRKANPPQPPFCKGGSENASALEESENASALEGGENASALEGGENASALEGSENASALEVSENASALEESENASALEGGENASALERDEEAHTINAGENIATLVTGESGNIPPFAKGGLGGIYGLSNSLGNAKKTDIAK